MEIYGVNGIASDNIISINEATSSNEVPNLGQVLSLLSTAFTQSGNPANDPLVASASNSLPSNYILYTTVGSYYIYINTNSVS
jgi:hypothetical protein